MTATETSTALGIPIRETIQARYNNYLSHLSRTNLGPSTDSMSRNRPNASRLTPLQPLLRCWLAAWTALLLIFIHPSLTNLGQATFFAALILCIVPPAGTLFLYLLAAASLLLGMCLAWAWGLLTMKAALAARPDADTQKSLGVLQKQAAANAQRSGETVQWEAQILVHDGYMLDARVTAVYYVMSCVFIYALARLRCHNPKFMLTQIFGTIVTDIFLLFGPGLPRYNASLASLLVKPGAVGVALGVACCLVVFPRSTSHVILDSMGLLVAAMEAALDTTRKRLRNEALPLAQLKAAKAKMVGIYKTIDPSLAFLPLDFSRGPWNADDVKSLQPVIREALAASLSLLDVHTSWVVATAKEAHLKEHDDDDAAEKMHAGHRELVESAHIMEALRSPEETLMHDGALQALQRTTEEVLQAAMQAVRTAAECIKVVNACRWVHKPSQTRMHEMTLEVQGALSSLQAAKASCVVDTTEGVLDAYADLFDANGDLKSSESLAPPSYRGIILAMVVEERIINAANSLEALLTQLQRLMQTHTAPRIWLPNRLQYALSWALNGRLGVPETGDAAVDPETAPLDADAAEMQRRLRQPRCAPGTRAKRSGASRALIAAYEWLFSAAGWFGLRMVAVTIATAIPSAIPHSAGFFYREKGIWAVITAQTSVLVYMADFTFSLVSRGLGTVLGGVLGMLTWYVGSGSGPGNPYGLAAASGVAVAGVLWLRLSLPPHYTKATILGGATFVLVVGFSYDTHHIRQYGLPGVGYEAFWKRVVDVLIGFAAATVVQIVPRAPSATSHVCRTLSRTLQTLSDHYALLLSHWGRRKPGPLGAVAEDLSMDVAETLLGLNEMLGLLQWEVTRAPFDQALLRETQEHCQSLNQSLRRLLTLASTLPPPLQDRLARTFGLLDDRMVGDVMAVLNMAAQALVTGTPLPERLPTPLVRRFYEAWEAQHRHAVLSRALVRDEHYRRYCVAMSSYLKFLSTLDDLTLTLKSAVGECHVLTPCEDA